MMGATCGAAYPSGAHEFTVVGFASLNLFCVMFCRSLFVFLAIVLSVLQEFTICHYPFIVHVSSNFS